MEQIRAALGTNPRLAETLAREGRERFPDSPESDERDMIIVAALYNQRRTSRAQMESNFYFEHHPGGRYAKEVSILTRRHYNPEGR
jgi:hypothetical protein